MVLIVHSEQLAEQVMVFPDVLVNFHFGWPVFGTMEVVWELQIFVAIAPQLYCQLNRYYGHYPHYQNLNPAPHDLQAEYFVKHLNLVQTQLPRHILVWNHLNCQSQLTGLSKDPV